MQETTNSRGRRHLPAKSNSSAKAAHDWQQQAAVTRLPSDADTEHLQQLVNQHLSRTKHAITTAELIELLILRFPSCPKFASLMVDRLMQGDEELQQALREELS